MSYSIKTIEQFVGKELGVSNWITVDQERINRFAEVTNDDQWIHTDVERANASPLGSTIAHGYLVLSLLSGWLGEIGVIPEGAAFVLNYGADRLRFINFVKVNSRIRCRSTLASITPKPNGLLLKFSNTVEIEGEEKPAMIADTLALLVPEG